MRNEVMNKLVKFLAIAVLLPLGIAIPLLGISSNSSQSTNAQSTDKSLQQRVTNYQKNLDREIRGNEEDKVEQRCSVVKANLENVSARAIAVQKKRNAAYAEISNKLEKLFSRLEAQAFETTKLQTNLDTLYSKMASFSSNTNSYKQALADLNTIDCTKKSSDFIAALEAARRDHKELIILVADIRSHIVNTVKPSLEQVKKQIEDGQTVGGDQS